MRKQHKKARRSALTLRLWDYSKAVNALPYLRSVLQSLREHWLEMTRTRLQARRMDALPGRPNRKALIERVEIAREADHAEQQFNEVLRELLIIDVYCLDPVSGVALIPFRNGDHLAWFVFELFAPHGLESWRNHADPLHTRRPLTELNTEAIGTERRNPWALLEQAKESSRN